jgi:hypothetical protein
MRKLVLALSLVLVSAVLTYGAQAGEWVKFTAPDGSFSVLLPQQPKLQVVSHPENVLLTHNRYTDAEQGYAFVIENFDNVVDGSAEKYLDATRDGIIATLKATLISEEKLMMGENPGRDLEYSLTAPNGVAYLGRTRFYVVGPALYSLSYVSRKDLDQALSGEMAQKYFSSFKLSSVK